jgi:hypothetical protein
MTGATAGVTSTFGVMPPIFIGGSPAGIFFGASFGGASCSAGAPAGAPVPPQLLQPPQQVSQQQSQQSWWWKRLISLCRQLSFSQQQSSQQLPQPQLEQVEQVLQLVQQVLQVEQVEQVLQVEQQLSQQSQQSWWWKRLINLCKQPSFSQQQSQQLSQQEPQEPHVPQEPHEPPQHAPDATGAGAGAGAGAASAPATQVAVISNNAAFTIDPPFDEDGLEPRPARLAPLAVHSHRPAPFRSFGWVHDQARVPTRRLGSPGSVS